MAVRIDATISGQVFKTLLGGLFDQVNDTIQQATSNARNAGVELEIEAGKQLCLAIENARNAYESELDKTIEKVDVEARKIFDRLNSAVQKFQTRLIDEMQDLKLEAQLIVNALPFSSKKPQLMTIRPRYIVIGDVEKITRVVFGGNFPCSGIVGFDPALVFAGKACVIFHKDTKSITFEIPGSAFRGIDKYQYGFMTGTLTIPWDDGLIWSHKTQYEYQVGLGSLPQIAGEVTANFINKGTERVTKPCSSPTYFYDGNDWYPEHWHTIYQDVYPEPGWQVDVAAPVNLHKEHVHGDHKQEIISVAPNKITVKIGLYCKDGHDIGKVRIRVDFQQWQYRDYKKSREERYEMNWKDDVLLKPADHEEISDVEFKAYDGSIQRFAAPDISDRSVLKIASEGSGIWKLWAAPPKEV